MKNILLVVLILLAGSVEAGWREVIHCIKTPTTATCWLVSPKGVIYDQVCDYVKYAPKTCKYVRRKKSPSSLGA